MSRTLEETPSRAAKLEACRDLVDDASRRANDAMESAIRRQSISAELAAYRLEAEALALEAALCRLEEASEFWWECHGDLAPERLLTQALQDGDPARGAA